MRFGLVCRWWLSLALACGPAAQAQNTQCPGSNASWSFSMPPPLSLGVYDLAPPPGVPVGMLTMFAAPNQPYTSIGVPQTVAQQLPNKPNPVQFYQTSVQPVYHALLLVEKSYCPLLTGGPGGALWIK